MLHKNCPTIQRWGGRRVQGVTACMHAHAHRVQQISSHRPDGREAPFAVYCMLLPISDYKASNQMMNGELKNIWK